MNNQDDNHYCNMALKNTICRRIPANRKDESITFNYPPTKRFSSRLQTIAMSMTVALVTGCATQPQDAASIAASQSGKDPNRLLVVDCLLPGQVRQLGTRVTYLTPRRPIKTVASECEVRGGEYVAYDRANFATSLKIWLPKAQDGDAEAQTYVGEIYEKGLGIEADYPLAAQWYRRAAEQGYARARINLGYLYEAGLGVPVDLTEAMNWYRKASGIDDGSLEYVSSAELVERKQATVELKDLRVQVQQLETQLNQGQSDLQTQRDTVTALRAEVEQERSRTEVAAAQASQNAGNTNTRTVLTIPGETLMQISTLKAQLNTAREEQLRLTDQLQEQQLATAVARKEYTEANRTLSDATTQQLNTNTELTQLTAELEQLQINDDAGSETSRTRQAALNSELTKLTQVLTNQNTEIASLRANQSKNAAQIEAKLASVENTEAALKLQLDNRNTQVASLQNELAAQNALYQTTIQSLRRRIDVAETEQTRLTESVSDTALSLSRAESEKTALQANLDQQSQALQQAIAEKNQLNQKLAQTSQSASSSTGEVSQVRGQLAAAERAATTAQQEQQKLQDKLLDLELALLQSKQKSEQNDAENNVELQRVVAQRQRTVETQRTEIARLADEVSQARTALNNAANDSEVVALNSSLADREKALSYAQDEQQRLTEKLIDVQLSLAQKDKESAKQLAALEARLQQSETLLAQKETEVTSLEEQVTLAQSQVGQSNSDQVINQLAFGPSIEIIEPPQLITRGVPTLPVQQNANGFRIIGKVGPLNGLLSLSINGQQQTLNDAGVFQYTHTDTTSDNLSIVAVGNDGNRKQVRYSIALRENSSDSQIASLPAQRRNNKPTSIPGVQFGNYYALIVGNNNYPNMTNLRSAENDARVVDQILRARYGFKTELLINADKESLLSALNRFRETLTSKDNLIIYYAGHGELDRQSNRGYWLPVDASASDNDNWISNKSVTDIIDSMKAKHVMAVVDSCYSGTLTRTAVPRLQQQLSPELTSRWYKVVTKSRVRVVLSSGGVKPVYDSLGDSDHSLFAKAFIEELKTNEGILEAYDLYIAVQQKVAAEAKRHNVDQNPLYSPIQYAGHEAGEFFFLPQGDDTVANNTQSGSNTMDVSSFTASDTARLEIPPISDLALKI